MNNVEYFLITIVNIYNFYWKLLNELTQLFLRCLTHWLIAMWAIMMTILHLKLMFQVVLLLLILKVTAILGSIKLLCAPTGSQVTAREVLTSAPTCTWWTWQSSLSVSINLRRTVPGVKAVPIGILWMRDWNVRTIKGDSASCADRVKRMKLLLIFTSQCSEKETALNCANLFTKKRRFAKTTWSAFVRTGQNVFFIIPSLKFSTHSPW